MSRQLAELAVADPTSSAGSTDQQLSQEEQELALALEMVRDLDGISSSS